MLLLTQGNNSLINKLLLGNDAELLPLVKEVLSHLLHVVDLKGLSPLILSILSKVIASIKTNQESRQAAELKAK